MHRAQKTSRFNQWLDRFILLMLISLVLIFILYPFIQVIIRSFYSNQDFDFTYYRHLFKNPTLITNSLKLACITTILSLISSLAVALYYYLSPESIRRVVSIILGVTMISPPFVTALSYITLFGRRGWITYGIFKLRLMPYGMWGVGLMQMLGFLSMNSLILIGSLNQFDEDIIKSARSLHASTTRTIIDIILPNIKPAIMVATFLTFIRTLADFGTPTIIGGNFTTLATEGYLSVIAQGNFQKAATINVLILIPAIIIFLIYNRQLMGSVSSSQKVDQSNGNLPRKGWLFQILRFVAIFMLVWISLQYLTILLSAFTKMQQGQRILTLSNFKEAMPYIDSTIWRSVRFSLIAAFFGSIFGLLIGYYGVIREVKIMKWIDFVATLPYVIPGTFFGLGYILAFNHQPLYLIGTATIIVTNVLFKQLPFSSQMGKSTMQAIDRNTLRSIQDLGGEFSDVIRDGILPLSIHGLILSFMNAFISTMTTLGSIIFLMYPRHKVLTIVMFDVIARGRYDIGSVIAFYIMIICILVYLSINRLAKWVK